MTDVNLSNEAGQILQMSAQVNSMKQLIDELVNANIQLRSQALLNNHQTNVANEKVSNLEKEVESHKARIAELEKPATASVQENAEAAA